MYYNCFSLVNMIVKSYTQFRRPVNILSYMGTCLVWTMMMLYGGCSTQNQLNSIWWSHNGSWITTIDLVGKTIGIFGSGNFSTKHVEALRCGKKNTWLLFSCRHMLENKGDQIYSYPKDLVSFGIMGAASWNPSDHHISIVLRYLRGPMMPRYASLSDSECNFCSLVADRMRVLWRLFCFKKLRIFTMSVVKLDNSIPLPMCVFQN